MVEFGAFLPAFGYPAVTMDHLKEAAREAEKLGYQSLQVGDHYLYTEGLAAFGQKGMYEAMITLSQLAAVTAKIRLGAGVLLVPLRNPLMLAHMIATLDQASGGRVDMGVGIGNYKREFDAANISFKTRARVQEETLKLMVRLWTEDEVTHRGEFFQMERVTLEPKPLQKPYPGFWFGGEVRKTFERAVRLGVGWGPWSPTTEHMAEGVTAIREFGAELGRDLSKFRFICETWTAIDRNAKKAEDALRPALEYFRKHHQMDIDMSYMRRNCFIGTPDEVAERIQAFIEVGANEFHFAFCPWVRCREGMRLMAEEVIPRFKG